jgi:uncharacterized protein (TIGR04255 family)
MTTLPEKLDRTPLVDAMFELRFEPTLETAGDLLPGMLYSSYQGQYSESESLVLSNVPRGLRKQNPQLKFHTHTQLTTEKNILKIGDRAVVLSIIYPYPGWTAFSKDILELLEKLREISLIKTPIRFSLRYINLIPADNNQQLALLKSKFEIAGEPLSELGLHIRYEVKTGDFLTILKMATNSVANIEGCAESKGLLIDIDTIQEIKEEFFWNNTKERLDNCHNVLKNRFFSLLLPETIESLGPNYESVRTTN